MDEIRNQENIRERGEFEKYDEFNEDMVEVICPYCSKDSKIKKSDIF